MSSGSRRGVAIGCRRPPSFSLECSEPAETARFREGVLGRPSSASERHILQESTPPGMPSLEISLLKASKLLERWWPRLHAQLEQWIPTTPGRPTAPARIGVVLSGGGLRGAGHVGVLQQLAAHKIPIDVIVGSSAGAIV